ncbi:hypothetical protein H5410_036390 [Solanum commersonii]|uniref:Uncharacterized protein n=1 Tax=Solanum commersonii TaxID=4109 RepID=A0A9J5Y807_SOLCO|nr:hypothetical protein H5410_036390 [Solanum commersonii]
MQDFSDDDIDAMEELANQPIPEHVTREISLPVRSRFVTGPVPVRYRSGPGSLPVRDGYALFFPKLPVPVRFRPVVTSSVSVSVHPGPVVPVSVPLPAIGRSGSHQIKNWRKGRLCLPWIN